MGLFDFLSKKKLTKLVCPNCKNQILVDIYDKKARCPHCGIHISTMFRKKCPKCKAACELDAKTCYNCGFSFETQEHVARQTYTCPICGYKADYYMIQCPACGTKFI